MYFVALAADYDGTLATEGRVDDATIAAVERLIASGRKAILVTGRELPDLERIFSRLDLFERVVAENGGLLYRPQTKEERPLAAPPPAAFVGRLRARGVTPLSVGRVIVASWVPHDREVLEAIRELGLELQITYNKGAAMVLPAGINKASGLAAALQELGLASPNVVGIGDAENDQAFLRSCGCAVAVANALPSVKQEADWTTAEARGAGVRALIERLQRSDLRDLPLPRRAGILLGTDAEGGERLADWRGEGLLLAGSSGGGKTTFVTALIEQLFERGLQLLIVDPEGEYEGFEGMVSIGDAKSPPKPATVLELLAKPDQSVAVNLLGIPLADRPAFLAALMAELEPFRMRTGRPHWVILDEAHHLLPAERQQAPLALPRGDGGLVLVTTEPKRLAAAALAAVDILLSVGEKPGEPIAQFAQARGAAPPAPSGEGLAQGEGLLWRFGAGDAAPVRLTLPRPKALQRRHARKYAEGRLGDDVSFYFRGPEGRLNLRAHNLETFLQMAEGVDDETWMYHLRAGDISRWFRDIIKDEELADETSAIETDATLQPGESRQRVKEAVERRYTAAG